MDQFNEVIIIDNGSGMCKVGKSGQNAPTSNFASIIGKSKYQQNYGMAGKDMIIGEKADLQRSVLNIEHPIEQGIITNWDHMERIWNYCFIDKLKVTSEEFPVLISESPLSPKVNREKIAQIMFEKFNVPGLGIEYSSILSLLSAGTNTGVAIDIGYQASHIVPVFEWNIISQAIEKMDLAGNQLTKYLGDLIKEKNQHSSQQFESIYRDMKEKLCYVALDFDAEMNQFKDSYEKVYDLPDGNFVLVENQRFRCPEALFQPSKAGKDFAGIHELTFRSINKCEENLRNQLFQNIALSGGSSMFPGTSERLSKELTSLSSANVKIYAPPDRNNSVWNGGVILQSLSSFQNKWITKDEYSEFGSSIIHKK